jgi:hypothetical protein
MQVGKTQPFFQAFKLVPNWIYNYRRKLQNGISTNRFSRTRLNTQDLSTFTIDTGSAINPVQQATDGSIDPVVAVTFKPYFLAARPIRASHHVKTLRCQCNLKIIQRSKSAKWRLSRSFTRVWI